MARIRRSVAIDLGTAKVLVFVNNKGVVLSEPSVIAVDVLKDEILAVGDEAKKLVGRTPGNVKAVMPLKDGVIADFPSTERMLKYFLDKSLSKALLKPDVLICVPSRATQVEKRAVLQASENAGAHRTYLIEEALAAAIGAGVDITDAGGELIVDIGGGTTDIAVISMGQIIASTSVPVAGLKFDTAIKDYIRKRYGLLLGDNKAEEVKIEAGSAEIDGSIEVTGREIATGLPQKVFVPVGEIELAIKPYVDLIVDGVKKVLEVTPPELAADIYEKQIILTGGGAYTIGLRQRLAEKFQIDVNIAKNADQCVVIGTGRALTWLDEIDQSADDSVKAKQKELESNEKLRRR